MPGMSFELLSWSRPYRAVLSARFRQLLQYRAAALAGLMTQLFWGLIRIMVLAGFYACLMPGQEGPMPWADVVTYIWLGQALLVMFPWQVDSEVAAMVRTGTVAYELVRPLDMYKLWFSRALAQRTSPVLMRAVPLTLVALTVGGMQLPTTWSSLLAWTVSLPGMLALSCALTVLMSICLFWSISGEGVTRMLPNVAYLFSGMVIPLPFFPEALQPYLFFTPFAGLVDHPYRLYTGHLAPESALAVVATQWFWIVVLVFVGRLLLRQGVRRLVIQGG